MKFRRYIPIILTLIFICVMVFSADAQCEMCKRSAAASGYGRSLNRGIEYLLLAPVVILGSVLVIWIRNRDKFSGREENPSTGTGIDPNK